MTILGVLAWLVSGLVFCALIPGLSILRGTDVVADPVGHRGERPVRPVEHGRPVGRRPWLGHRQQSRRPSGIALYGVVNELSRLVPAVVRGHRSWRPAGELANVQNADTAWLIAIISAVAFVVAIVLIVAVVRSERDRRLARTDRPALRVAGSCARLGRQGHTERLGARSIASAISWVS